MKRVVIVGPASQALGIELARVLAIPSIQTEFKTFPDGENYLRLDIADESVIKEVDAIILQSCGPGRGTDATQNVRIFQLIMMIDIVKRLGAARIQVVAPYLAYGRQDKIFRPGECKFAEVILQMLERAGATDLYTVDQHAPEIFNAVNIPVTNVDPMPALADYCQQFDLQKVVVVSPDKGAVERSKAFARHFGENTPVEVFSKERDVKTGEIQMTGSMEVQGSDVIIADDIISTGGTIMAATRELRAMGASTVTAACTHGLFAKGALPRLKEVCDRVVSANTLEGAASEVSVAPQVARFV